MSTEPLVMGDYLDDVIHLDMKKVGKMLSPVVAAGSRRVRVPPRTSLGEITPNNVGTLRKLNMGLFPVAYSDNFYKSVLLSEVEDYCKLVFYQDLAVGSIVCRLEVSSAPPPTTLQASVSPAAAPAASTSTAKSVPPTPAPSSAGPHKLYVMTLGVLAPYRRQGLASKMLRHVIAAAEATHRPPVAEVYKIKEKEELVERKRGAAAPVAAVPKKAVVTSMYLHVQTSNDEAKTFWEGHGFKVTGTVPDYYRKIEPRDAWIMERDIVVD